MCGIAGIVTVPGRETVGGADAVRAMAGAQRHRGPDAIATWGGPSGRCLLGHARLRVIDLHTGDQPMGTPDQALQVVFNGEIYNFRGLRGELERAGYSFRTRSDTEVLLHGYDAWGQGVVQRLDGMFAFALWDERKGRLLLARDRAGKKPLFLYRGDGFLAFASEIKGLLACGHVPGDLDPDALPYYLAYGYVPGPRTLFRGIVKLPPGHICTVGDGGWMDVERYWRLPSGVRPVSSTRARREVRGLLAEAVAKRLEADVPLGAFLSGGIDSGAVVGLMSRLASGPVKTFSIGFEGAPGYDETGAARAMADHFGTEHTEFRVGAQSVELVDRLVEAYDEPFGDSSAIPTHIVSGLAREHVTVALTGDGGDELFAGYLRFRAMCWAEVGPRPLVRAAGAALARFPLPTDFRHPLRRTVRFLAAAGLPAAERMLRWIGYLPRPEEILRPEMSVPDRGRLLSSFEAPLRERFPGESLLARTLRLNFETYLPEDLLVKADRASMAHGLELRSPFLDTDLVEYAALLPDRLKIRGTEGKAILRDAVADLLPREILHRPKMGFAIPLPEWLRGPWRPLLEERLLDPSARIWDWLDRAPVVSRVEEHVRDRADHGHLLWALLTLQVWAERHAVVRSA